MNMDAWRKTEIEATIHSIGFNWETASKSFIQEDASAKVIPEEFAQGLGVQIGVTCCPTCDRIADESEGCSTHGKWW